MNEGWGTGVRPGPAIAALALMCATALGLILPASADADLLLDRTNLPAANPPAAATSIYSQDYDDAGDVARDSEAADDFTVPNGQHWSITEVRAVGLFTSRFRARSFDVRIYRNTDSGAGFPQATPIAVRLGNGYIPDPEVPGEPYTPGDVKIKLRSPISLSPGTYWLSVQARGSRTYSGSGAVNDWMWGVRTGGSEFALGAVFRNPGGGVFGAGCTTFTRLSSCPGYAGIPYPDLLFSLEGTSSGLSPITISGTTSIPTQNDIVVSSPPGTTVTDVNLTLTGVKHARPDEFDVLLVSPGTGPGPGVPEDRKKVLVLSNAGGFNALTDPGVNLTLDDEATSSVPNNDQIVSGQYKPSVFSTMDSFVGPAPSSPYSYVLSEFDGINPNGTWKLFIRDDAVGTGGGILDYTLDITTTAEQRTINLVPPGSSSSGTGTVTSEPSGINCTAPCSAGFDRDTMVRLKAEPSPGSDFRGWGGCDIAIGWVCFVSAEADRNAFAAFGTPSIPVPEEGSGTPSPRPVSGRTGVITDVDVTLDRLSHTFPSDLDLLLVGPGGQSVVLVSDVGGGKSEGLEDVRFTLDDSAPSPLSSDRIVDQASYRPTNAGGAANPDGFPAPAPGGPYPDSPLLSVFNGTDPNGAWTLYAVDDAPGDRGYIGDWSLDIDTANLITAAKIGNGSGTIASEPAGIVCGADCSERLATGSSVTLTAAPDPSSDFAGWTGCDSSTGVTCTVAVNADRTATATFNAKPVGPTGPTGPIGPTGPPAVAPQTKLVKLPKKVVKTSAQRVKVKFLWTSDKPDSSFRCKIDKGPFAACTSPKTYSLKPGSHTFQVAASAAGLTDATPARFGFKVRRVKRPARG